MDQNNNQSPKHVQVENAKKPEKEYIISYLIKDGALTYQTASGLMGAFTKMAELEAAGAKNITVYQQVELKITAH